MSENMTKRLTVRDIRKLKLNDNNKKPIVSLVCYTSQMARLINDHIDNNGIVIMSSHDTVHHYKKASTQIINLDVIK